MKSKVNLCVSSIVICLLMASSSVFSNTVERRTSSDSIPATTQKRNDRLARSRKRKLLKRPAVKIPNSIQVAHAQILERCYVEPEPWHDGDCELQGPPQAPPAVGVTGPVICFRSNGTGSFRSRARSTDTNDTYYVRYEALDENGARLFYMPGLNALGRPKLFVYKMFWSHVWGDFNRDFTFPAQEYDRLAYVTPTAGC